MLTLSRILARLPEREVIVLMRRIVAVSGEYDDDMDAVWWSPVSSCSLLVYFVRWAEAPVKIARMTLTIKLDGNWSSFQLANSASPLSVTDSAIAPSARMLQRMLASFHNCVHGFRQCSRVVINLDIRFLETSLAFAMELAGVFEPKMHLAFEDLAARRPCTGDLRFTSDRARLFSLFCDSRQMLLAAYAPFSCRAMPCIPEGVLLQAGLF